MSKHYELGKKGEQKALELLQKKGYAIVAKNWRFQKAEIDVIAKKDGCLICVEVKTRSSQEYQHPKDTITHKKIKLLVAAMNQFVQQKDFDLEVRFDLIAITQSGKHWDIEHLENAFHHF